MFRSISQKCVKIALFVQKVERLLRLQIVEDEIHHSPVRDTHGRRQIVSAADAVDVIVFLHGHTVDLPIVILALVCLKLPTRHRCGAQAERLHLLHRHLGACVVVGKIVEKIPVHRHTECRRSHNVVNSLYLKPDELERKNFERYEKYRAIEENEAMWEDYMMDDAEIAVVAFGIASRVAKNAVDEARREGIKVGLIRPITLWPFPTEAFVRVKGKVRSFISVELNMGQMIEDIKLASECSLPVYLCNRTGGMIPSPEEVLLAIKNAEKGDN